VARAAGLDHLAAATGSTSEAAVKQLYGLPEPALIDMGDFVGGTLKYLRTHPVPKLTLAGGFGKLAKLAQGHLFLHSSKSRLDMDALAASLAMLGAPAHIVVAGKSANTAAQVLSIAEANGLPLARHIAQRARAIALDILSDETALEVLVFDRAGGLVGGAGFDD
jgi:cobalt-precorrin-5B (C1)-methyltransferase